MTNNPIIIKRVKKGGHGHHGGAWKVAYADFVTAMMAFFLLMWLLNTVNDDQLMGISNYFAPSISTSASAAGAGHVLGGETIDSEMLLRDPPTTDATEAATLEAGAGTAEVEHGDEHGAALPGEPEDLSAEDIDELIAERDEAQFEDAMRLLREAIESSPELAPLADSLLVANTPEGLHIQIIDQAGLPMFPRGRADMYVHTKEILRMVVEVIGQMPQEVAVTGHTDATPFASNDGYSNWELSTDRANAARRALTEFGVPAHRFSRVVGKAATEPLDLADPKSPANRRLSVVLLRGSAGTGDNAGLETVVPPGKDGGLKSVR